MKTMTSKDVIDFYAKAGKLGIRFWIDGGWAMDALLGEQTQPHSDLDIAIYNDDVPALRKLLKADGYEEIRRDSEWNFVLGDDKGHEIDVHTFLTDAEGNITGGIIYPKESLTGTATIEDREIRCISPKYMVEFIAPWLHKHKEKYLNNLKALCDKFGIDYPQELKNLLKP